MISRKQLLTWLDNTLQPDQFKDYAPNGLQVEGSDTISHIVTGVTASLALIEAARDLGAEAILVHHGWFWRNEDPTIRMARRKRIQTLLDANINLLAYHLPLDAHPVLGNNAQLARRLGLIPRRNEDGRPETFGPSGLIWQGHADPEDLTVAELVHRIGSALGRTPVWVGDAQAQVGRVAWCTGGAQGMFETALQEGARTYITGEISEPSAHIARENDATFISAGHHATERYGVMALGESVQEALGVPTTFVDIDNPA